MNFFSYSFMLAAIAQMCKVLSVTSQGRKKSPRARVLARQGTYRRVGHGDCIARGFRPGSKLRAKGCRKYLGWCHSFTAKFANAESIVALGESAAVLIDGQLAVIPGRVWVTEGAVEEDLAGCGYQQVGPSDDLGDVHGEIVGDAGELVAWNLVATPDEEVTEVEPSGEGLKAEVGVVEFDDFSVRDAKTPV